MTAILRPSIVNLSGRRNQFKKCVLSYSQATACVRATRRVPDRQRVLPLHSTRLGTLVVPHDVVRKTLNASGGMNIQARMLASE